MERAQWVRAWKRYVKSAAFHFKGPIKCWNIAMWRLQSRSKLWSSETTTVPMIRYCSQLPTKALRLTSKDSWREWIQAEDGAMKRCKCSSRPSTRRRWLTRSFLSATLHIIEMMKYPLREVTGVNPIGIAMVSSLQIWHNKWTNLYLKKCLYTRYTWIMLRTSEL